MKRILFVHHVSVVGGASYCLLSIIKELDRNKYLPIVLLRDEGPLVDELRKLDIEVHFCPSLSIYPYNYSLFRPGIIRNLLRLYWSMSDVEQAIAACSPNIVYFNNTFLFPYLRITKKLNIRSVIHIREHWPADERQRQFRFIQKQIEEKADRIVAINEFCARMISPFTNRVTIVYDWIDLDKRYKRMPMSDIVGEDVSNLKVYLYTGGMQSIKGAYEVLNTFSEKILDKDSRLLVLGFTKEVNDVEIRNSYEHRVKEIARRDTRIICIPSEYYLKDLFDQAYCMLSYFTMAHANLAMAEAMISGLPVIAAKTEESLEYSQNGRLAMLFEMNNIADFEKTISGLSSNYNDLKHHLALHNNELKEMFSRQVNSKRLMSVLESL